MEQPLPGSEQEQQLKQRAMRRLALALALIAAAIIALALLDRYIASRRAPQVKPAAEPPAIAGLPEPTPVPPVPESARPPEPLAAPPPPPVVGEEPAAPLTPAPARQPGPPTAGASSAAQPRPSPLPPAAKPPAPGPPLSLTDLTRTQAESVKGFVVQTGVFVSTENALALQARLKDSGIPTFLETRVVAGPFRNRTEAEAARKRLRALGLKGLVSERR